MANCIGTLHQAFFKIGLIVLLAVTGAPAVAEDALSLPEQLQRTQAQNLDEILDEQLPGASREKDYQVADPYSPDAQSRVQEWWNSESRPDEVCAVQLQDAENMAYLLANFDSAALAGKAGYIVTHQGRCGSCSSLQDLAVYLSVPNLTNPARSCARKFGLSRKKDCLVERTGLSEACAESWSYNMRNTRQQCMGECIKDYGFINTLLGHYPDSNVDDAGALRACLLCDEEMSGPGFKFSAGRTRRNSGIKSAIPRPDEQIYPVDHSLYFPQGQNH